jgi:hypothetical protein
VLVPVEIDTAATMWTDETGERTRQALAVWALERVGPVGGDPNTVRYRRLRVLRGPLADAVVRETGRTMGAAEAAGLTVIDGGRVGRHG